MGKYNFDEVIDRHGTDCLKYDFGMKRKGRDDLLPLDPTFALYYNRVCESINIQISVHREEYIQ